MQDSQNESSRKIVCELSSGPRKIVRERSTVFVNVVPRNETGPWMTTMSPSRRCSTMSGFSCVSTMPSTTESSIRKGPRMTRASVTRPRDNFDRTRSGSDKDRIGTDASRVRRRSPVTTAFLSEMPCPVLIAPMISAAVTAWLARSTWEHSRLR